MASLRPPPAAPTQTGPAEKSALQKLVWFGLLQLAGIATGWVVSFLYIGSVFGNFTAANLGQNPSPSQLSATLGPLYRSLAVLVPIVSVVQIAALLVLILALRQLKAVDARFSVPATLALVLLVGTVLAGLGGVPHFNAFPGLLSQAPPASGATAPAGFASAAFSVIVYFVLIAIGGMLALVGLIGGQILGLWRAGSKYDDMLLKLGAIFAIIPFLNAVAPILIIVGALQVKGRVSEQMTLGGTAG